MPDLRGDIDKRLGEALESLRKDVMRVEIWAVALASFAQPVPGYDIDARHGLENGTKNASKNKSQNG